MFCGSTLLLATTAQSISGVVNSYYRVTGINIVPNTITVSSATGLTPGLKILIIQMKGAGINSTNTSSFGDITSVGNAGNYEINYICGISGNNVLLKYQLLRTYDAPGTVQLIPVPQYTSVTVSDTVKAASWNSVSGTGGVVILEASDTIFLNAPIDASGKGFIGGALLNNVNCVWATDVTSYTLPISPSDPNNNGAKKGEGIADFILNGEYGRGKQATGGGGGNSHNTGGGGGSNYGIGGNGGNRSNETFFACHGLNAGLGGASLSLYGYSAPNNRIFMGGGGGSGHQNNFVGTPGGNGGGIILLIAKTIVGGANKLLAGGGLPYNATCSNPFQAEGDGGGGGGAGGTIILDVLTVSGSMVTDIAGANGSVSGNATNNCTGPGGGGGGGVLWVSNAAILPGISVINNGGANGTISIVNSTAACRGFANGAIAGVTGAVITGYSLPIASNFVCAPLSSKNLLYFNGKLNENANLLEWEFKDNRIVQTILLERSINQFVFDVVKIIPNPGNKKLSWTDFINSDQTYFYRLIITDKNGRTEYSPIIRIKRTGQNSIRWISISPNPATTYIKLSFYSLQYQSISLFLYNRQGQIQKKQYRFVSKGNSEISIPVNELVPGLYFIKLLDSKATQQIRKFIVATAK